MSSIAPFPGSRPPRSLFDCENEVISVVDRLAILCLVLDKSGPLDADQARAVGRLVSEALTDARAVQAAWSATYEVQS